MSTEYLVGTDLQILNLGNKPTFFNMVRKYINDITVAAPGIAALFEEWRVSNYITFFDHRHIDFEMDMDPTLSISEFAEDRLGDV